MARMQPVVVYPPDEDGGRRVRIRGEIAGRAFSLAEVVAFLRRAGVEDVDEVWVRRSSLIEWRGGGFEVWEQ